MKRLLIGLLMTASCGGSPGDKCKGGGGDLSVRDVCYCLVEVGCSRINDCPSTRYASEAACLDATEPKAICDRESDAKVLGPNAVAPCLRIYENASCDDLKTGSSADLNGQWSACVGSAAPTPAKKPTCARCSSSAECSSGFCGEAFDARRSPGEEGIACIPSGASPPYACVAGFTSGGG